MEGDPRPQREAIAEPVRRQPHAARCKPIERIRLVLGSAHQARKSELGPLRAIALENEAIEGVESEEVLIERTRGSNMREDTALWRVRVHIIEMLEVCGIFELPEGRHSVMLAALVGFGFTGQCREDPANTEDQRRASRKVRQLRHYRVPILAAFSASHHHTVGNPDSAYFGRTLG